MEDAEQFCRDQWRSLARTLAVMTGDVPLAEDLAQEALARVVASWPRVRLMRSPGGYAHRIAVNLAKDALRRRRREQTTGDVDADPTGDAADRMATSAVVGRALASLPPRQRLAMSLRYLSDLSVEDTAAAMGCRPGTVKSLCHHATQRLQGHPDLAWHDGSTLDDTTRHAEEARRE